MVAIGIALVVAWWSPAFVAALQVVVALSLIVWGTLALLMGISERKAKREFEAASMDGSEVDEGPEGGDAAAPRSKTHAGAA